ncbi:MAG: phosphatidylglycerophosphatase A family protein [Acetobacteraceae bacterium]
MRPERSTDRLARWIAAGFGCGHAPRAPGTVASFAATLIGCGLLLIAPWALAIGVIVALASGLCAIAKLGAVGDPGWVVIDEIAGQWITLLVLPYPSVPTLVAGFLFFRAFDILKPGPVHWVERAPGAFGVMADDVLAGILAALLLFACRMIFPIFFTALAVPR